MTPVEAKAVADFVAASLEMEAATTKKVIAAVPMEQANYCPHERSTQALELCRHIAGAEVMLANVAILGGDAPFPEEVKTLESPEAVITWYEAEQPKVIAKLRAMSGEDLAKNVSVWGGMFTLPAVHFAAWALTHGVHHRGQLSAYLRPMGAKVPSIYGPSGDEGMNQ